MKRRVWFGIGAVVVTAAGWALLRSGPSDDTLAGLIEVNFPGIYDVKVVAQVSEPDGRIRMVGTTRSATATYNILQSKELAALCGIKSVSVPDGSVVAEVITPEGAEMTFNLIAPVMRAWLGDHMEVGGWLKAKPMDYVFSHKERPLRGYTLDGLKTQGVVILIGTPEADALCVGG